MIKFVSQEEFFEISKKYLSEEHLKRFVERKRLFIWFGKNFYLFKIPFEKSIYYFLADYNSNIIYSVIDNKKLITEIKLLTKNVKEINEELYIIFSKILDLYSEKIGKISKIVLNERKKLFESKDLNIKLIERVLNELDDLEDYIMILRIVYKNTLKDKNLISILAEDTIQILDEVKEIREKIKFLLDLQINIQQNLLNYRMEKLTILSTIFLPATLIASIYGMNFSSVFPKWNNPYGFIFALLTIFISSILTYIIIMKKLSQAEK